jgi:hypothetical protein
MQGADMLEEVSSLSLNAWICVTTSTQYFLIRIQMITEILHIRQEPAYRLDTGWTTEGSEFESRYGRKLSPLHVFQTGSGARPASYAMSTGGIAAGP